MSRRKPYALDVVVPCFNEEHALPANIPVILAALESHCRSEALRLETFRLILVDDGSQDATWPIIERFAKQDRRIQGIKLSRNFGHQRAMLAGLGAVSADVALTMDADLQDDISVIRDMLAAYESGSDIALGVRVDRSADTAFKNLSARFFYRLLSAMGVQVIHNHADFRLMSRPALAALLSHEEVNLYLRGIIPTLGFATALIPYQRKARELGESKYTLRKMLRLALDGITSFSTVPLRLIAILGFVISAMSALAVAYVLATRIFWPERTVAGWASTLLPLVTLAGAQILSIGVLGEYIGKIYLEVKRRPRYIVDRVTPGEDGPSMSSE